MYVVFELYFKYMFNDLNYWFIIVFLFYSFKVKWINCDFLVLFLVSKIIVLNEKNNLRNKLKYVWIIYVWCIVFLFNDLIFLCFIKI